MKKQPANRSASKPNWLTVTSSTCLFSHYTSIRLHSHLALHVAVNLRAIRQLSLSQLLLSRQRISYWRDLLQAWVWVWSVEAPCRQQSRTLATRFYAQALILLTLPFSASSDKYLSNFRCLKLIKCFGHPCTGFPTQKADVATVCLYVVHSLHLYTLLDYGSLSPVLFTDSDERTLFI